MYKSKLQIYAQKRNLLLPEYDAEQYGPPHVSQFRCSVTVDRQTYWSEGLSPTVKDAEQSAAKVALQALHPEGNEEEDLMYKSMLKEKIQKKGGCRPSYMTWKTDRVHLPTFLSTVEVEGVAFMGGEARTKKLAQMSAAKFAYTQLMEGKHLRNICVVSISM
ncbi:Double-stranded RNA-binding protein 4 [Linum perenne]